MGDLLRFAPKDWLEEYEKTASLPVRGPIQDPHEMVHDIIGNYAVCGKAWCNGSTVHPGWKIVPKDTAFTCFECVLF